MVHGILFCAAVLSGVGLCGLPGVQVYNTEQARRDIQSLYSMGLFDDVSMIPHSREDSTADQPVVHPALPSHRTHIGA